MLSALAQGILCGIAQKVIDAKAEWRSSVQWLIQSGCAVFSEPSLEQSEQVKAGRGTANKNHYKHRNLIERFFLRIEHFRRIATRYEKLAERFSAFIAIVAIFLWLA